MPPFVCPENIRVGIRKNRKFEKKTYWKVDFRLIRSYKLNCAAIDRHMDKNSL
jgi:hypothetical protein